MRLSELLETIPESVKLQVEDAKSNFNQEIREHLRKLLGVGLVREKNASLINQAAMKIDHEKVAENEAKIGVIKSEQSQITIKIQQGYPDELRDTEITEREAMAALLSSLKASLHQIVESSKDVSDQLSEIYKHHPHAINPKNFRTFAIEDSRDEALNILSFIGEFDLTKKILDINKNFLGLYRCRHDRYDDPHSPSTGEVILYWQSIGLLARTLGVGVKALTAVTLIHEMAHAHTHLGYDINGFRWTTHSFVNSDKFVIEGLAQYYTELVAKKMAKKQPEVLDAYQKLVQSQHDEYRIHQHWIDNLRATPEDIREALIKLRVDNPFSLAEFEDLINRAKHGSKSRHRDIY